MKKESPKANRNSRAKPANAPAKAEGRPRRGNGREPERNGGSGSFELLLEYLQRTRGFDFSAYKRSTLQRRVIKRMQEVGLEHYGDYVDFLEVHPEEFEALFNTILINVTTFFRDESTWEYLAQEIIPRILDRRQPPSPVRAWSAGCASGEEAYSLAVLLAEALGGEQFRQRVKIYGTDADEESLNQARLAAYTPKQVEQVPPALLRKYFELHNEKYVFNKELRRSIIFGRHDLIQDAPISRVDLIVCRNTLMYFNAETQSKIIARFGFGLSDGGYLILGKAEMLLTRLNMFAPVDVKHRVFTKIPRSIPRDRVPPWPAFDGDPLNHVTEAARVREAAFDADLLASIVVDLSGRLILANETARASFNLSLTDLGRLLQDLDLSYRPIELRPHIEQAYLERRSISLKDVEWTESPPAARHFMDVTIIPLFDPGGSALGVKIIYSDVTRFKNLQEQLQHSHQELETTNEELQSANEELETTNEELQSANEELETTNEELQSSNEELETMNEELQSTNAELAASNEQLRVRTEELDEVNGFNAAILTSLNDAVIGVDPNLLVTAWNRRAEELWGMRAEEVMGKQLVTLDIGLPVEELREPVRAVLSRETPMADVTLPATNRRGKAIRARVTSTPLGPSTRSPQGVILLMEEKREDGA